MKKIGVGGYVVAKGLGFDYRELSGFFLFCGVIVVNFYRFVLGFFKVVGGNVGFGIREIDVGFVFFLVLGKFFDFIVFMK